MLLFYFIWSELGEFDVDIKCFTPTCESVLGLKNHLLTYLPISRKALRFWSSGDGSTNNKQQSVYGGGGGGGGGGGEERDRRGRKEREIETGYSSPFFACHNTKTAASLDQTGQVYWFKVVGKCADRPSFCADTKHSSDDGDGYTYSVTSSRQSGVDFSGVSSQQTEQVSLCSH